MKYFVIPKVTKLHGKAHLQSLFPILVQWLEHLPIKQKFTGSNPVYCKKRKTFPVMCESALMLDSFENQVFIKLARFCKVHKKVMQMNGLQLFIELKSVE